MQKFQININHTGTTPDVIITGNDILKKIASGFTEKLSDVPSLFDAEIKGYYSETAFSETEIQDYVEQLGYLKFIDSETFNIDNEDIKSTLAGAKKLLQLKVNFSEKDKIPEILRSIFPANIIADLELDKPAKGLMSVVSAANYDLEMDELTDMVDYFGGIMPDEVEFVFGKSNNEKMNHNHTILFLASSN